MPKPKRITPAFPNKGDNSPENDYYDGMSLRDYFAAKAMEGMLANNYWAENANGKDELPVAVEAYRMADAMLSAREVSDAKG